MIEIQPDEQVEKIAEAVDEAMGKGKTTSKTLVVGLFSIVTLILQYFGFVGGQEYVHYEAIVIAILMVALRIVTREPVDFIGFFTHFFGLIKRKDEQQVA